MRTVFVLALVALAFVVGLSLSGRSAPGSSDPPLSDARLKIDVAPLEQGLDAVLQLNPVTFGWDPRQMIVVPEKRQIDLITQEVAEVLPEAVYENGGFLYVSFDQLVPVLVEAVQEQEARLEAQAAEIAALTARVELLEAQAAGRE